MVRQVAFALTISLGLSGLGGAHSGMVDGYALPSGRGQGQLSLSPGAIYWPDVKSKEEFLRQLRGGKAEQLSPKSNPPQLEKKIEE